MSYYLIDYMATDVLVCKDPPEFRSLLVYNEPYSALVVDESEESEPLYYSALVLEYGHRPCAFGACPPVVEKGDAHVYHQIRALRSHLISSFIYCMVKNIHGQSVNPQIDGNKIVFSDTALTFYVDNSLQLLETINVISPPKKTSSRNHLTAIAPWFERIPWREDLDKPFVYKCKHNCRQRLIDIIQQMHNLTN